MAADAPAISPDSSSRKVLWQIIQFSRACGSHHSAPCICRFLCPAPMCKQNAAHAHSHAASYSFTHFALVCMCYLASRIFSTRSRACACLYVRVCAMYTNANANACYGLFIYLFVFAVVVGHCCCLLGCLGCSAIGSVVFGMRYCLGQCNIRFTAHECALGI